MKRQWRIEFDCVVPAPPSVARRSQPVVEIARALAKKLGIPTCEDAVIKSKTTKQMKNIQDFAEREKVLQGAIQKGGNLKGKRVLLVDDLCESGATIRRTADVLLKDCGATSVHAVVLTRTK